MNRSLREFRRRVVVFVAALAIAGIGVLSDMRSVAQEQAAAEPESPAASEDLFQVPEGDADALYQYMEKLAQTEPEGESQEEQIAFSIKALSALAEAADRLLAAKPTPQQAKDAQMYRAQGLRALKTMLQMTGGDTAEVQKRLDEALQAARQSDDDDLVRLGWQGYIDDRTENWSELDDAQKQAFRDEVLRKVEEGGPQLIDVSIASATATNLDRQDEAFAAAFLAEVLPKLQQTEDQEVKDAVAEANFEGMLRRLKLPGNPMEINGSLLSGGEVDWNSYRGKVVLVDFWATWCGPCKAELPNILKMYEGYHDKGFEVLGVSLDQTEEEAKSEKLPWDSIFPGDENQRGFDHPLVKYYGINGIPTAILVDKEGKVVSMNARGPELRAQLKKLLGDPIEKPAEEKPEEEKAEEAAAK
ncbi:MAG: hypothetical protein DCC67_08310 [Planctomycetota bacterium]|nr:MAG: hypothetical protein DCC67_08310 [Planctomycetota bacterium]